MSILQCQRMSHKLNVNVISIFHHETGDLKNAALSMMLLLFKSQTWDLPNHLINFGNNVISQL